MKSILLAAAAFIAAPAIAQEAPAPAPATDAAPADPAMQAPPAPAPADPAMQAPPAPAGDTMAPTAAPAATTAAGGDPVGGYQPSTPPITGTATPGAPVQFKQAPDPATAYPAPAPMEKYPVCKKGQFDKCIQRGGK